MIMTKTALIQLTLKHRGGGGKGKRPLVLLLLLRVGLVLSRHDELLLLLLLEEEASKRVRSVLGGVRLDRNDTDGRCVFVVVALLLLEY